MDYVNLETVVVDGVTYSVGDTVGYGELGWSSDWNGDEVGYDDIDVVGLYHFLRTDIDVYLDTETGRILEMWRVEEEV